MDDSKVLISEDSLTDIGNAIRNHNGETDLYYPSEMPDKIRALDSGTPTSGCWILVATG